MTAQEWLLRGKNIGLYITQLKKINKCEYSIQRKNSDLNKEIERQIKNLEKVRLEIITAIEKVHNNILCSLLIGYYINGKTIADIAEDLHYTERHIGRLHKKALNEIKAITGCS